MTTKINGSTNSGSMTFSEIIGDAMMTSVKANKVASVLTVKNYHVEADAQTDAINHEVEDNYKTQDDNIKEWNKEHKHKIMHKIFGFIFHAIRTVSHLLQPRKMVKSVVNKVKSSFKKVCHPKTTVKSLVNKGKSALHKVCHPKTAVKTFLKGDESAVLGERPKLASKEMKIDSARKFAQRTSNWGDAGLEVYDSVGKAQITKINNDIDKLQLAKSICENNYESLESAKKQEMQTVSERLSDVAGSMKAANDIINRKSNMQSQIISSI